MKTIPEFFAYLTAAVLFSILPPRCFGDDPVAANLSPGVMDVIKLVKAGLGEDVVLAQIRSKGATYNFTADQLIYLHQQGVTPNEITAMIGSDRSAKGSDSAPASSPSNLPPAAAPTNPAPVAAQITSVQPQTPAPVSQTVSSAANLTAISAANAPTAPVISDTGTAPTLATFQSQLAPYGTWVNVVGVGLCWQPTVAAQNRYWRPYLDQGHWTYTADGWYWQSDYPWGGTAFHYGRWQYTSIGWVWAPGYDWAPAWVCWRDADGYSAWAPLPPSAVFRPGLGLYYNGHLAVDVDFGLGINAFTFVPYDRFWEHNLHAFILGRDRIDFVFGRSHIANGYRFAGGHFVVEGIGRERMAFLTHREIREEVVRHEIRHEEHVRAERRSGREEHRR